MKLPDLKKTKLSTVSTFGVVSILATAMIIIAIVAIAAIRGAGLYSLKTTKAAIKEEAVKLLQENTKRKAEEYSEYFKEGLFYSKVIAEQTIVTLSSKKRFEIPSLVMEKFIKKYKRSNSNMPYSYYDKANNTLSVSANNDIKEYEREMFFLHELFILLDAVRMNNTSYYNIWLCDYSNYINCTCSLFIDRTTKLPNIINYRKFLEKAYEYNKTNPALNISAPYKDVYGPMVLTMINQKYNTGYRIAGGIDLLFEEIVADILSHNVPLIGEKLDGKNPGYTFIVGRENTEIVAMSDELYTKLQLPVNKFKEFKPREYLNINMNLAEVDISALINNIKKNNLGNVSILIDGEEYLFCYHEMSIRDWFFCVAVSTKELYKAVEETEARMGVTVSGFIVNFLMVAVFFMFILLIVVVLFFKTYLVKPIISFRDSVLKMGQGDLETPIKEKGVYEIAVLANSFNDLRVDLKDHMENFKLETVERQRRENELKTARQVQLSVLPMITSLFKNRGIQLYAKLLPAIDVAGDYYDFFYTDKNKLVLIIADVSGKGISASFYMAVTKRTLRNTCISEPDDPAKSINLANKILCNYNINMFVTLFLVYYDMETGEMKYANGGHNEAVCLKADGTVDVFGCLNNAALGCFAELPFTKDSYKLEKGDTLYVYTDGIVEANRGDENFYGLEKFTDLLIENRNKSLGIICKTVIQDVHVFEEGGQFDDITILAMKRE